MLIDSHCHLDYFDPPVRDAMLDRARAAGVGEVVTIGTRLAQSALMRAYAESTPGVWCTVGVHPHNADEGATAADLVALAASPRCVGIGESGLDYHYETAPRNVQAVSFREHIRACQVTGLPLVIHAREADEDITAILSEERERGGVFPLVLHCFSSGRGLAEAAIAMGGYVSFSGILTFPKSHEIREIARDIPAERLLVETDSPYLAPVPHRGKRCEPAMVAATAAVLASLRGLDLTALAELTTRNFRSVFQRTA